VAPDGAGLTVAKNVSDFRCLFLCLDNFEALAPSPGGPVNPDPPGSILKPVDRDANHRHSPSETAAARERIPDEGSCRRGAAEKKRWWRGQESGAAGPGR